MTEVYIHPSADVHPSAKIGAGTKIWSHVQVRENAEIGAECILGRNVYVEDGVPNWQPGEDTEQCFGVPWRHH